MLSLVLLATNLYLQTRKDAIEKKIFQTFDLLVILRINSKTFHHLFPKTFCNHHLVVEASKFLPMANTCAVTSMFCDVRPPSLKSTVHYFPITAHPIVLLSQDSPEIYWYLEQLAFISHLQAINLIKTLSTSSASQQVTFCESHVGMATSQVRLLF